MPGLQAPQGELATIMIWKEATYGVFPTAGSGTAVQGFHAFKSFQPNVTTDMVARVPRGSIAAPLPGTGGRTIAMSLDVETDEDTFPQLLAYTMGAQTAPSSTLFTTTSTAMVASGASSIPLASTNFIFAGQQLAIDTGGTPQTVTVTGITGINTVSFTPVLTANHASGVTCSVIAGSGAKMTLMTMGTPLPSFTLQVNRPGGTSTDYLGTGIDNLALSFAAKAGLQAKFALSCQQVVNDGSPVSPTMSVLNPYIFEQQFTCAQIGGEVPSYLSGASLLSWNITVNNNLNKNNFAVGSGNTIRSLPEQMRKVSGSMKLLFETATQYNNANAAATGGNLPPITILLPLQGTDSAGAASNYGLGLWMPNVMLSKSSISDDTSKMTELTFNFECGESAPGAQDTLSITSVSRATIKY